MYTCEECGLEFETFQAKANHHRWKHLKYAFKNEETKKSFAEKQSKNNTNRHGEWIEEDVECSNYKCKNLIHIRHRKDKKEKHYCSVSCAMSHQHTQKSKDKCSNAIKLAWKNGTYNTESYFEKQSKNKKFSSKKEREIVEYFKSQYPENEWKSGGHLKYKENGICRDLYSDVLKLCFEYDGIWHFKEINGQLKKKQLKDKLLEEWCLENKYRLIRIDEKDYTDFQQIEDLFFNRNEPIIKIGQRY